MKRIAYFLAAFAALVAVAASADAAGIGSSQAPNIKVKNGESSNWAGYAVPIDPAAAYQPVTDVKGTWTVPSMVGCTYTGATTGANVRAGVASNGKSGHNKTSSGATGYSSAWVGIDGDTSNTVEQIGTEQDCINGSARFYAWYEMYPQFPVNLSTSSYPVVPGDTITGEVQYTGGSSFVLTLTSSRGWTYSTPQSSSSARLSSAEWIVEAPWSGRVLPLADFGTVGFQSAQAGTNGGKLVPISSLPNYSSADDAITMVTNNGTIKAQPSELGKGGDNFAVTWYHK